MNDCSGGGSSSGGSSGGNPAGGGAPNQQTQASASLVSIAITPSNSSVPLGVTEQFTATGTFSDGTSQNISSTVSWSSTPATVATVNSTGLASGKAAGTATVTAVSGAISGQTTLTITSAVLQSISITPVAPAIAKGLSQQFTAKGLYSDGSMHTLTYPTVTWSSSSTSVAAISVYGVATGKGIGTAAITAASGTITANTTLTVTPAVVQSFAINPLNATIYVGKTQQFSAIEKFSDGTTQDLTSSATWSSSQPGVATISSGGLAAAVSSGMTAIMAATGSYSATAALTVTLPLNKISAGYGHTCGLLSDTTIQCWGLNTFGQLGNNSNTDSSTPVLVANLTNSGTLSGVSNIAAGGYHTCALMTDTTVQCWGYNMNGQLGNGPNNSDSSIPVSVVNSSNNGPLTGVTAIAAGDSHTCALISGGTVQCWGSNSNGQLGNNSRTDSSVPVLVTGLSGAASAIAAGDFYTCALISGGTIQCWGINDYGQLGNGTTTSSVSAPYGILTPVSVSGISTAIAIDAGGYHTCALLLDSSVQCWGWNIYGQLGNNSTTDSSMPVSVVDSTGGVTLTGVSGIAVGDFHTCAMIKADGSVQCWGNNANSQLGDNTNNDSSIPVSASVLTGSVTDIVAGYMRTCGLISGGTAQCWGHN